MRRGATAADSTLIAGSHSKADCQDEDDDEDDYGDGFVGAKGEN